MWLARCRLTIHEPLFFATREIGRLYETGRYLHNYALTYALGLATAPFFNALQVPRYAEQIGPLNDQEVYVSPAQPLEVTFQLATFKYGEEELHVEMLQATRNTPSFGRAKEIAPGSRFECFVLSPQPLKLPRWVRLGKWHSKAQVDAQVVETKLAEGPFTCPVPLNPLDVPATMLRTFDVISMPPSSLLGNARLDGAFYQLSPGVGIPAGLRYGFPQPPKATKATKEPKAPRAPKTPKAPK